MIPAVRMTLIMIPIMELTMRAAVAEAVGGAVIGGSPVRVRLQGTGLVFMGPMKRMFPNLAKASLAGSPAAGFVTSPAVSGARAVLEPIPGEAWRD